MPMIDADGCLLNVSVEGRDGGPTLMLSNSLGCTLQMWEPQMKALTQLFRVIRYDRRGHGKSGVPPGPYSMERFGRDVLAILDDLNIEKVHWCGLSMGGMVGQWLGANAPERLGKIVLSNTACSYADPTNWLNRIKAVKEGGVASVADTVIAAWLTADFREREPQITANMKALERNYRLIWRWNLQNILPKFLRVAEMHWWKRAAPFHNSSFRESLSTCRRRRSSAPMR